MKDRPKELLTKLPAIYRLAAAEGMTLSQFLEDEDPSHEWTGEDRNLTAFQRVQLASGFRFRSCPEEGIWADTYEKIYEDQHAVALIPEWGRSIWRRVRSKKGYAPQAVSPVHQRINESGENTLGSFMRPYVDAAGVYGTDLTPGISLADLLAMTTPINGDTYRRAYLDDPLASDTRLLRIAEVTDIPRAVIRTSEHVNRLFKYGRAIEMSYEAIRRVPIDKVGIFIAKAALQVESDRVAQAIDVLINGDGNASTAAVNFTQGGLDTGTTLTVKGWIAFKSKFKPPYTLTHVFAREAELVNLQMLTMPSQNPLYVQVGAGMGFGGITPLQDLNGAVVRYGQSDAVGAGVYLGIDQRFALERITEIGSDVQETTNFIERQTTLMTMTENDGFALLDSNANKTFTMA